VLFCGRAPGSGGSSTLGVCGRKIGNWRKQEKKEINCPPPPPPPLGPRNSLQNIVKI